MDQIKVPYGAGRGALGMASAEQRLLAAMLRETDVLISVPHDRAARVREVHALVLHCLSDGVDAQLLGEQEIPL